MWVCSSTWFWKDFGWCWVFKTKSVTGLGIKCMLSRNSSLSLSAFIEQNVCTVCEDQFKEKPKNLNHKPRNQLCLCFYVSKELYGTYIRKYFIESCRQHTAGLLPRTFSHSQSWGNKKKMRRNWEGVWGRQSIANRKVSGGRGSLYDVVENSFQTVDGAKLA